jgi:DNA-nicking Smr family endonuclease
MHRVSRKPSKDFGNQPFAALERLKSKAPQPAAAALPKPAPRPVAPPPPARKLSDEELFLQEVGGARPIQPAGGRVGAPPPDPNRLVARPSDDAEVLAQLADLCGGDGPFDIADSDEYIEGLADGIDRRLLKRLRGGEYAVQAHIDLHGQKREEAKERVGRFILESRKAGRRCVLIVHGRGLHSKDQIPVLKQSLRTWLERGQMARSVLAFATARPTDGGAGAVYVLLRR